MVEIASGGLFPVRHFTVPTVCTVVEWAYEPNPMSLFASGVG